MIYDIWCLISYPDLTLSLEISSDRVRSGYEMIWCPNIITTYPCSSSTFFRLILPCVFLKSSQNIAAATTSRLLHKLLGNVLATFGLSSNFWATYGLEHFFGNLWSFEHFFGNFFQSEKIYPFLVTKISFLCISSLTKRINIHVNSIVMLYWLLNN